MIIFIYFFIIAFLIGISLLIDENDDYKFNENMFFKLFVYNEYLTDIYKTNKEYHFRQILKDNGYIVKELGTTNKLKKVFSLNL